MGKNTEKNSRKKRVCGISEPAALKKDFDAEKMDISFSSPGKSTHSDPSFGKESAELFASGKMTGCEKNPVGKKAGKEISSEENPHAGHRARLRTRYLQAGSGGMTDFDLLELLLTYAIPRRDVKMQARALLEKFRSPGHIMDAEISEITSVAGISENSALLFRIIKELCERYLHEKISGECILDCPQAVEDYARMKIGGCTEEVMLVIYVNVQNCVMDSRIVSRGTVDSAIVYPREIAAEALAKKASGVILVHNHPGGNVTPSEEDMEFTKKVRRSLNVLDIVLLDHLIVSRTAARSIFEKNHIG